MPTINATNLGGKKLNSFTAAYAYSHAIDSESSTFGDSYFLSRVGQGQLGFQGTFNPSVDKGNADFDMRHRFVAAFNWDVPYAHGLGVRDIHTDSFVWRGETSANGGWTWRVEQEMQLKRRNPNPTLYK